MMDNDFNAIKPVENLANVIGLTPAGQQQERRRRQNAPRQGQELEATSPRKAEEGQDQEPSRDNDPHTIDYRA